jgi:hypothetical protein
VIAKKDKDSVLREMLLFKHLTNASDGSIDRLNAAVVVRKLCLPRARQSTEVLRHIAIDIVRRGALRRNWLVHIVLLTRFKLRDKEEERLVLFLAKETLGTIGDKVDAILILVGDLFTITIPDASFVGMRNNLGGIGPFP